MAEKRTQKLLALIEPSLFERLKVLANKRAVSQAEIVRRALKSYLYAAEDRAERSALSKAAEPASVAPETEKP